MKFLADAQLPRRLARWLSAQGHDAVHTLDLPAGNRTQDDDFVQSFWVQDRPRRLLLIATGNSANADLERLLANNLAAIVAALGESRFVELSRDKLVVHD